MIQLSFIRNTSMDPLSINTVDPIRLELKIIGRMNIEGVDSATQTQGKKIIMTKVSLIE